MAAEVPVEPWSAAAAAIAATKSTPAEKPLALILLVQQWCPPAVHTAKMLETLRKELGFVEMVTVDCDEPATREANPTVFSSPAMTIYFNGNPVLIQRVGWPEDVKLMGCPGQENLIEMLQYCRQRCEEGHTSVPIEW